MFRAILLLCTVSLTAMLLSCSGSKKGAEGGVAVEDAQVQAQIEALQEQIKDNPNNPEYRRQLATIYKDNGFNLEAMKTLEGAMQMDPNDAETKFQYAETALAAGDKLKAYTSYKEVLMGLEGQSYVDRIAPYFMDAFQVTKLIGGEGHQAFASFSSDGQKVIYQTDLAGNWDIYEFNMTDQTRTPLVQTPNHEENPAYDPKGKNIVYTSTVEDHRDVDYDQKLRDIFLKNLETGLESNLTTNGSDDWHPQFSDDGKLIAFVSERNDLRDVPFYERFGNIFIMEADGRFQLELAHSESNNGSPCFLKGSTEEDGTIFFDSNRDGDKAIYRMDMKGENLRQITFNPGVQDVGPDISPNGDKIVFFSDRDGNYELYMMNSDGSAQQRLTSNGADDLNPKFSPDGQKILFHSDRGGDFDVYLMDLSVQTNTASVKDVVQNIDTAISALH